jgi:hypothetical protein
LYLVFQAQFRSLVTRLAAKFDDVYEQAPDVYRGKFFEFLRIGGTVFLDDWPAWEKAQPPAPQADENGTQEARGPVDRSREGCGGQAAGVSHSPDFASVNWFGTPRTFSPKQRPVVHELWAAWVNGTPDVSLAYLLEAADLPGTARLPALFRDHPAFGTMIVKGGQKDTFRLQGIHPRAKDNRSATVAHKPFLKLAIGP